MEGKVSKIGKLHGGGGTFETGPGKNKPEEYQKPHGYGGGKGLPKTGPAPVDMEGHKAKGPGLDRTGTKRDEPGEDSAGKATGKRGNVKGY